jgi:UDP-N-acetylglucosamine:LPS N-acetylglucosamine transferase
MALAQARYLSRSFDLIIAIPEGPLRSEFERFGELTDGTGTLPLWGGSVRRWITGAIRSASGAGRMFRLIRRADADVVLTNSSVSIAPVLAARLADVPVVVHARDVPESRLSGLVFALHGALADTIIVIAEELGRRFRHSLRARVVRIYEGIAIPDPPSNGGLRRPGDPLRLCLIGGIDPRKGQDIAVDAVARLRDRGISAQLELVGREIQRGFAERLREQVSQLDVVEHVRFTGEVPDVDAVLSRADVAIAPSRSEWTPLSLMEAMAFERPVVAARVGGVAEVVVDPEVGLLTPPQDANALTEALTELAAEPKRARAMGRQGRRRVTARFNIARSLDELRRELHRLLDQRA